MDELFIGSALCEITIGGELLLPHFFHETARRRSAANVLLVGLHDCSPCLVAYDRQYATQHHISTHPSVPDDPQRLRRIYGFVEQTPIAPDGMIVLPALMRDRGRIGATALLVATGERFEIWDLEAVLHGGPSDLILLATHHRLAHIANEVLHVPALSSHQPRCGADMPHQPGLRVQPVSQMRPRHDPVGRADDQRPVAQGAQRISRDAP